MLSSSVPFARDIQNYTIASGTIISLEGQTISVRLGNGAVARGVRINSPLRPYLSVERKGTLYYDNGSWVLFCLNYQQGDDEQDSVGIRYTLGRSISTHVHTIYAPVIHAHAYADEGHSHVIGVHAHSEAEITDLGAYTLPSQVEEQVMAQLEYLELGMLFDVSVYSPKDGQHLEWYAGTAKWEARSTVVYSILTDGNLADPQLIFVGGDVVLVPLGI